MVTQRSQLAEISKLHFFGLLPIPIRPTGNKDPAVRWGDYRKTNQMPWLGTIKDWFRFEERGIAVMGGPISGGFEQLDFDNHETAGDEFQRWCKAIPEEVLKKLIIYKTPNNGVKVCWRAKNCSKEGHIVLAYREPNEASIELLCAEPLLVPGGSPLAHPSGKPYEYVRGHVVDAPWLDDEMRNLLIGEAKKLSKYVPLPKDPWDDEDRLPGDNDWTASGDFNHRATWEDILEPHDWRIVRQKDDVAYWCRPGKYGDSVSASTNYEGSGMFYCWSSNTEFEQQKGYQKWAVYAVLNFTKDGKTDFSGAAKELARLGYGRANYDLTYFYSKLKGFYENKPTSTL